MAVVLLALLLATSSAAPPSSPVASPVALLQATPDEQVEAWHPAGASEAGVARRPRHERDDTAQALAAVLPVTGGVLVGGAGVLPANALPAAVIIAVVAFVAAPSLSVALFVPDLPGWAPWLTAVFVPLGGVALGASMLVVSAAWLSREAPLGSDCRGCGVEGLLVPVGAPVAAVVGATMGGLAATTLAAFAPQE
jgi:hypothetical protein